MTKIRQKQQPPPKKRFPFEIQPLEGGWVEAVTVSGTKPGCIKSVVFVREAGVGRVVLAASQTVR